LVHIQGQDAISKEARQLAFRQLADLEMLRGHFVKALRVFESLTNKEKDALWLAEIHRFRGHVNRFNFNLIIAEEYYQKALSISENIQADAMRGKALTNLAETLCWASPNTALSISDQAIEINQQVNAPIEVGKAMAAQAIALAAIKETAPKALSIAKQAISLQEKNGYRSGVLFALQAKGLAEFALGRNDLASSTLQDMQHLIEEIDGMYAYLPMFLSILLDPSSNKNFPDNFEWLNFKQTLQTVKTLLTNFSIQNQ
jgi:tetratricopeptide (TPR) repeat protein